MSKPLEAAGQDKKADQEVRPTWTAHVIGLSTVPPGLGPACIQAKNAGSKAGGRLKARPTSGGLTGRANPS